MGFVATRDPSLYEKVRDAFVSRHPKPEFDELSAEFEIPRGTIGRLASEEGWVSLRAATLERKVKESDALAIVLEAVKIDRTIIATLSDVLLIGLRKLGEAMNGIPETHAASTKAEIVNTCSFALKNFADAAKSAGIMGVSKTLNQLGDAGNGRWNPEMLQQINVTVQNLQAVAKSEQKPADPPSQAPVDVT